MKINKIKICFSIIVVLCLELLISSCQKDYSSTPFGYNYIYMPQATVSGGLNLNYSVPAGYDTATNNYKIDTVNNKVNVYLGVLTSGKEAYSGYKVNVSVNNDTINQIVGTNAIVNGILLPENTYTLPSTVTIPAGKNSASFYLSIDASSLKSYSGKIALIAVELSNPTRYVLNSLYNKVIVMINVNALNLK